MCQPKYLNWSWCQFNRCRVTLVTTKNPPLFWREIGMPDLPPNRSTASTASVAKWSFSCCNLGKVAGLGWLYSHSWLYMILYASLCIFLWVHKAKLSVAILDTYDPRASISQAASAKSHSYTGHEPHLHLFNIVQYWPPSIKSTAKFSHSLELKVVRAIRSKSWSLGSGAEWNQNLWSNARFRSNTCGFIWQPTPL